MRQATNIADPTMATQAKGPTPLYANGATEPAADLALWLADGVVVVAPEVVADDSVAVGAAEAGRLERLASVTKDADIPVALLQSWGVELEVPAMKFTAAH